MIHTVDRYSDWLLHLDDKNCERYGKGSNFARKSKHYKEIEKYFEENFGPRLSELVDV